MLNYRRVRLRSNRTAQDYEKSNFVQCAMAERMMQRLDYIRIQPSAILDLGCATGWLAEQLASRYPAATLYGIDFAEQRLVHGNKYPYLPIACDMHALSLAPASVDLIIANDSLHWAMEPAMVMQECYRVLKPGGLLMMTTFGAGTMQQLRELSQQYGGILSVHDFKDMHDWGDELSHAGFSDPVMDSESVTVRFQSWQQLVLDGHRLGVGSALQCGGRGLIAPGKWQRFWGSYQQDRDGQYPINLELVQGHAWKVDTPAANRINESGEVVIPLSSLKR